MIQQFKKLVEISTIYIYYQHIIEIFNKRNILYVITKKIYEMSTYKLKEP